MQNPLPFKVGGAYTNAGEVFIRVILEITPDDIIVYRDFAFSDGKPIGTGRCSLAAFKRWSARPVAEDEILRLDWQEAHEQDREVVQRLLDSIPDGMLVAEARRRGFIVTNG